MNKIEKPHAMRWERLEGGRPVAGGVCVTDGTQPEDSLRVLAWIEMDPEEMEELAVHLLVTAAKIKEVPDV